MEQEVSSQTVEARAASHSNLGALSSRNVSSHMHTPGLEWLVVLAPSPLQEDDQGHDANFEKAIARTCNHSVLLSHVTETQPLEKMKPSSS